MSVSDTLRSANRISGAVRRDDRESGGDSLRSLLRSAELTRGESGSPGLIGALVDGVRLRRPKALVLPCDDGKAWRHVGGHG